MVVNIFKMYFARFLFFSILLYNIEAKAYYHYYDWEEPVSKDDNTTMVVTETEGTTMKPEPDVFNNTDTKEKVDSAGWLTIENGILTAHFPETVTTTELPDYVDALNVTTNKTDSIPWYNRDTTPAESNSTATTTWDSDNSTTTRPVGYAIPDYETTTVPPWYRPWYHGYTTPSEEYRPWYLTTTTQRVPSWLPRTRRPTSHRHPWYPPPSHRRNMTPQSTTTPTTTSWYTTTEKSSWGSNLYYNNTTWSSSGNDTTEFDYGSSLNSNRNDTKQTTGDIKPDGSCKSCNPLNISINSKINPDADGETGNYGTFANFLKKIVGKILPSAFNVAPNANGSSVAVANGNGNMFFYVFN